MEIIIQKLVMRNFKGVMGERVVEFSPTVTKVYGANRTGKTTIADAFRWCLFGKNTEGKADFGIKTKDAKGEVIPELEHEVTVTLLVDGQQVSITRTYTEKWTKPRGVAEKVLTGHTTTYMVNGQLYTQRDFNDYINSLCSESLFMAITSPTYFVSLKTDQQRSILTQMVGEVSPASVAQGKQEFEALLQIMGEQDIEKFRQHLSYQMKEIKAELERIPVRISEQQNDIAGITPAEPVDWKQVEGDIKATEAAIKRIADAIAETIADQSKAQEAQLASQQKARQQVRTQIAEVQDKMNAITSKHTQAYTAEMGNVRQQVQTASDEMRRAEKTLAAAQYDAKTTATKIADTHKWLERMDSSVAEFKARWQQVDESTLVFNPDQFICPTCGRLFEAEDVEAKKAQMLANFNADKARKLDAMEVEAQQLTAEKNRLTTLLAKLQQEQAEASGKIAQLTAAFDAAQEAYNKATAPTTIKQPAERIAEDSEYSELGKQLASLQAQLAAMPLQTEQADTQVAVQGLQADQQQLQEKLNQLNALAQVGKTIANKQQRISQLEQQEQQLNIQLTQLEGQDYTAEVLLERTIEELENKVNALFSFVTFTMFDHKINGALKPMCECTVRGVPYSDLNNADRINAGIDIINAMCRYKGVYAPCFIDNAESINEVMPMQSQRIDLLVSTDKELVITAE